MELIYQGVFYSECNVEWEVKILSTTGTGSVGELRFSGSEPLTFEWNTVSKEVPLCGSSATLTIISPGDRTYEGLYTITPGSIRMDAYRNGVLYWSGTLDPEFYEEPYSTVEDYEVSLTFSDFGILDRLAYDMEGMKTLMDVLQDCIDRSGINVSGIDQSLISTSLTAQGSPITLGDLTVRSDNFYDEDGEASTLKEVLEGILQPLALRMVQRCGKIWIYDLNGLYTLAQSKLIKWMGSDQNMGVDVVYNNAKITWSTYAESGNLNNAECWVADTDPELTALEALNGDYWKESWYYSYHASTDHWLDLTDVGFTLWTNYSGKNAQLIDNDIKFFKIIPQGNGEACEGIALLWRTFRMDVVQQVAHMSVRTFGTISTENFGLLNSSPGTAIWKSGGVWIPPVGESDRLLIRISTGLLMDPRYNPYISAVDLPDGLSQKQWEELWNDRFNMIYIPVRITFTTDDGAVYVWTNRSVVEQEQPVINMKDTFGSWTPDATWLVNSSYLCWYNPSDRDGKSGGLGWKTNRQTINAHLNGLLTNLSSVDDGQYIPYPDFGGKGGTLRMEVMSNGWMFVDGEFGVQLPASYEHYPFYVDPTLVMSWCLMKLPEVSIVNRSQFSMYIDTDDVIYSAELNESAKDPIEIETICGTHEDGVPTARGAYFKTSDRSQVTRLSRAGRTTQAEELLIGTLYSQFADRKTKLTGTVELLPDGVRTYSESMQNGKRFILSGEIQDAGTDTSEATLIELRPDEYDKE